MTQQAVPDDSAIAFAGSHGNFELTGVSGCKGSATDLKFAVRRLTCTPGTYSGSGLPNDMAGSGRRMPEARIGMEVVLVDYSRQQIVKALRRAGLNELPI